MIELDWRVIDTAVKDEGVVKEFEKLEEWCHMLFYTYGEGVAIEVGSYCGRSTTLISQYFQLLAIDLWGTGFNLGSSSRIKQYNLIGEGPTWQTFIRNMKKNKLIDWGHHEESLGRVHPICSSSKVLEVLPPLEARIAFIDAEHDEIPVYNDLTRASKHLIVGGLAVVHDFERPGWGYPPFSNSEVDPWYGNSKGVHRFLKDNPNFSLYEHFLGIVAMRRNS